LSYFKEKLDLTFYNEENKIKLQSENQHSAPFFGALNISLDINWLFIVI